ncbi:MAG: helix-turn-helix transcriptional regulator [Rhizomicrobium sp.]
MSFSHSQIWQAIDALAQRHGLSPSGLARRAGLDPTTFNKSKRVAAGKPRWPSTESVAKALAALEVGVETLLEACHEGETDGYGADGAAKAALDADLLGLSADTYAVELRSDAYRPLYRNGDRLVVSPSAQLRKGHRVILKTRHGLVLLRRVVGLGRTQIKLSTGLRNGCDVVLKRADVKFMHRILFVSQ